MLNSSYSKNALYFLISVIFFRILLEISYVNIIAELFGYEGYKVEFQFTQYIISWVFCLIFLLTVNDRLNKISDYFFVTALLAVFMPLTIVYGYDAERSVIPVITSLIALFYVGFLVRVKFLSFKNLPTIKGGLRLAIFISVLFVAFLVAWYGISGVKINIDPTKVYEFRMANEEQAGSGILTYTNNWTYKIFNIFLFSIALLYRKYMLLVIVLFIQFYFYAASTHKTVFLLPFLVLGIWYYFKKTTSMVVVPAAFSFVIIVTIFTYVLFEDIFASSFLSRRVFFVPVKLTYAYFDYFNFEDYIYWSNSILSAFIEYPYTRPLPEVIASSLGTDSYANNGFISFGFAHAGFIGVFIYSTIVGLLLRVMNDITHNTLPIWLAVSLTVIPLRDMLISSDLTTVTLTHGLIVAVFLIFLARSKYGYTEEKIP